jgi:alpha-L-fucosidase 2
MLNSKKMILTAPIERWDEAIPLGNGMLGGLLWGDDAKINLSLDRGDLWDERSNGVYDDPGWKYCAIAVAVARHDAAELRKIAELSKKITATKLPVGRLEIELAGDATIDSFELDMVQACGRVCAGSEIKFECFADANAEVIRFKSAQPLKSVKIVPPDYGGEARVIENSGDVKSVGSLGYASGKLVNNGDVQYYIQRCDNDMHYAIIVVKDAVNEYSIFVKRANSAEEISAMVASCSVDKTEKFTIAFAKHCEWWEIFWKSSSITLPDKRVEQHYNLCRYFYGSASRAGAPPIPLQGVWTADNNALPPWRGDYHHDLNTQFTYIAYHNSGDFEAGRCFLDFIFSQTESYKALARDYYSVPGIAVPGVASLAGQSLGGWPQYSFSPTCGVWVAVMFTDYWKHTGDQDFLQRQAYPFCAGVAEFILGMLKIGDAGKYFLPLTSSPEIHNADLAAFLTPTSNYDLALIQRLFDDLRQMAVVLKNADDWQIHLNRMPALSISPELGLMVSPDENLHESHRHHSHLMAIYPLKLLTIADPAHATIIHNSLHHIDKLGTGEWVGYSFSWMAALNAYAGNGDRALRLLNCYLDGFVSRNGFHLNGDYKDLGYSTFKYRPFTLEGNFAAMQTVHEMLLQSNNGVIKVFPALPGAWNDVEFDDLRAENNIRVSAALVNGKVARLSLTAAQDCSVIVVAPGVQNKTVKLTANLPIEL